MNYEDTIKFLNKVNKEVYGIAPFSEKVPVQHDTYEYDIDLNKAECDYCHELESQEEIHMIGESYMCESCYQGMVE